VARTPKPRSEQDIRTPEKKESFLAALRLKGSVYHAAQTVKVGRGTVYAWRDADEEFAQAWDQALEDAYDALEESLYERGLKADTTAAIFILKGRRRKVFGDKQELSGGLTHQHSGSVDLKDVSDADLKVLRRLAMSTNGHAK
jgi:hypothetical protein